MRLVPQTLAARLTIVLLLGLVLAQLLSTAVDIFDRGRAFYRSTTLEAAQHISDFVKILDAVRPEERNKIVESLTGRALAIRLSRSAVPLGGSRSERPYEQVFHAMLRQDLGPGREIQVRLFRSPRLVGSRRASLLDTPANALDRYLTPQLLYLMPHGYSFVTRVRLRDGTVATFSSPLPYEHIARLYVLLPKRALMLAIVIGLMLAAFRWITKPVRKMAQAALALGDDLDRPPITETGPEEIRAATRALNVMQLRLQEYVRDRAAMLAALSHDLKTFITRVRLRSELLPASLQRDRLIGDLGEMTTMVNATLDFLHGISSHGGRSQFDVMALVESVRIDAEDMGWTVTASGATQESFFGNAQDLRRCLMNLVENAIKYGGSAAIRVQTDENELTIGVCDPGAGITPDEQERVFTPFYRGRTDGVGGAGLGLSIARTIARAHGGDVIFLPANSMPGFCAAIRLPLRQ